MGDTCRECKYYKPDYGFWTATGWTRDGSTGFCNIEPKPIAVDTNRPACRYFEPK